MRNGQRAATHSRRQAFPGPEPVTRPDTTFRRSPGWARTRGPGDALRAADAPARAGCTGGSAAPRFRWARAWRAARVQPPPRPLRLGRARGNGSGRERGRPAAGEGPSGAPVAVRGACGHAPP